jgi:GAF domain-containing protein
VKPRSSDIFRRYQEVAKIGQEINHELSTPADLFQKLQKHVARVLDTSDAFLLAIYQPQTNTIDTYSEDDGKFSIKQNDTVVGAYKHIIETRKTLLVQQMSKEAHHLPFQQTQMSIEFGSKESVILVPLVFRNIPLGVLSVQHKTPNTYNQEDLSILELLANHIALALHNIRLRTLAGNVIAQSSDDINEYSIGLFYDALNTLQFSTLDATQHEHALLCASILADKLKSR